MVVLFETTGDRMTSRDTTDKPFMIDKRLVYEAYKAVSWLVLVAPAARVCAGRYSAWSVSYELLSLSERCMGRGFGARCCLARGRQFGLPLLKPVA